MLDFGGLQDLARGVLGTFDIMARLKTPNEMKGRVSAVNNMFIGSSNEIGEFESGVTAKIMGLVPSVVFGGIMTLIVVLVTSIKAPKLRRLNIHELYKEQSEELSQK